MRPKSVPKAHACGFTLIELLVVIAIIGILAALLLPTLARAKLRAKAATCLSNQKQLAMAWVMYADDNRDLVINFDTVQNSAGDVPWRFANPSPLPAIPPGSSLQTRDVLTLQQGFVLGGLYRYVQNVDVLHCPADARFTVPAVSGAATAPPGNFAYASYSGAGGLNGVVYAPNTPIKKQSELLNASGRYLWIEENDPRGENESSWVMNYPGPPPTAATSFEDSVASWHGESSTFSWADGHAENHKWRDSATIAYALSNNPGKYGSNPKMAQCPNDLNFLANGYATRQNP